MVTSLKRWAEGVKRDVIALWIAAPDPSRHMPNSGSLFISYVAGLDFRA